VTRRYLPVKTFFYQNVALPDENGCMLWTRSLTWDGYAQFKSRRYPGRYAHRMAYELMVGPIPEGLQLDHLCKVRNCVTPDHLEPVTHAENTRRSDAGKATGAMQRAKTHCPHGHEYTPENTGVYKGRRYCKKCKLIRALAWQKAKREAKVNEPVATV
jgi:hypothetical protein